MAVISSCAELHLGQDTSCASLTKKYYQQAVLINKADIESYEIVKSDPSAPTYECKYHVTFTLKEGKTGYRFTGPNGGNAYFGNYDKSRNDLSYPQYLHRVQILVAGATEQAKCILDSLDKGNFVAAMQLMDGTVEVYGIENGMSSADYTYDLQANGGATAIPIQSADETQENNIPLVYKSETEGGEAADFDSNFAAAAA